MRCGRCGNENPDSNRFCGMCGASLRAEAAAPVTAGAPRSTAHAGALGESSAPVPVQSPPPTRPETGSSAPSPVSDSAPIITGPSFLGLNKPGPARSANLRHSRHHEPSRNLDYLLEDDEEPRRGAGKYILILLALALCVGFGYLNWKQGGFAWLNAQLK